MKQIFYSIVMCGVMIVTTPYLSAQEVLFRTSNELTAGVSGTQAGDSLHSYRVRVEEGTLIEVVAASDAVDTYIDAVLPDGTMLSNDDYDGLNAGFLRVMPESGRLAVEVSALYGGQGGPYTLTVVELPAPRPIAVGDRVENTLTKGTGYARRADLYHLRGSAGEQIVIDLISADFDAFLEVTDEQGRTRFDDDGGRGFDSRLSYRFEDAGSLIISASSVLGESIGNYELRVSPFDKTMTARYEGQLRPGGRRAYDGKLFEVYEYNGQAGQSVTISLESDDFDAVLYLSHADGRNITMDDDSGGDGNSLLDVVLPSTETYRIYVTSFFEGEGAYRLTVYE